MAVTVFGKVVEEERERREQSALGEPAVVEEEDEEEASSLEKRFEALIMSDIEFGPYYWETEEAVAWWRKVGCVGASGPMVSAAGTAVGPLDYREGASWRGVCRRGHGSPDGTDRVPVPVSVWSFPWRGGSQVGYRRHGRGAGTSREKEAR